MKYLEMNKELMEMFVSLQLMKEKNQRGLYDALIAEGAWVLEAITKHAEAAELEIAYNVRVMILFLADSVVGRAVKYIAEIYEWSKRHHRKVIDWKTFAMEIYPDGFPDFSKKLNHL